MKNIANQAAHTTTAIAPRLTSAYGFDVLSKMKSVIAVLLFFVGLSDTIADTLSIGPFRGLDLSGVPEAKATAIEQANTDIDCVLSGSEPKFAKEEKNEYHTKTDPRRHHVLQYTGNGYTIFVYKTPVTIGKNEGFIFGPQLNFHKTLEFDGWIPDFSQTRYWTKEDLKELLSNGTGSKEWKFLPRPWKKKK